MKVDVQKQSGIRFMFYLLIFLAVVVGAVLLGTAMQIEDWSRDLTTNSAETSPDADDPNLRPLELAISPRESAALVERSVGQMSRWQVADRSADDRESDGNNTDRAEPNLDGVVDEPIIMRLTRTTSLFRFVDDITVTISSVEIDAASAENDASGDASGDGSSGASRGSRIEVRSQSRIGKGDLGQNPRNIRELIGELKAGVNRSAPAAE
jgi:hypothetical protein